MRISYWSSDVCSSDLAGGTDTLVETCLTSVKTGRTMQEIAEGKKAHVLPRKRESRAKNGARGTLDSRGRGNTRIPEFRDLQLCTLVDDVPAGNGWIHEVKYDEIGRAHV